MPSVTRDVILLVDTPDPDAWLMTRQGALSWFAADHGTRLDDITRSAAEPQRQAFVATLSGPERTVERMLCELQLPEASRRFGILRVDRKPS